jgi:thioester reductase-like protein
MAPKIIGTWNLHELTKELPLDFFVCFSSIASVLGSPGQGNYAAANAFMDALVHYRRSLGLPAMSINWGPWDSVGMAAQLGEDFRRRLHNRGITPLKPVQGLSALENLLQSPITQVAVISIDWSVVAKLQASLGYHSPLLRNLTGVPEIEVSPELSTHKSEFFQRLLANPEGDRLPMLISYLQEQVGAIVDLPPEEVKINQSLLELGIDSLMAVELSTKIRREIQIELPIGPVIDDPSIANLANLLLKQLSPESIQSEAIDILDLNAEAVLDPAIYPVETFEGTNEPQAILLTGGTGFLGAFLLAELLAQTKANIYCLVRSTDLESGKSRLEKNLDSYKLWKPEFSQRIIPVPGDLSQPLMGLTQENFQSLAEQIETIYHNGALLSYVSPYSRLKPINVLGTQEVLRFATQGRIKPTHFISSTAVFESSAYSRKTLTESEPITESKGIYLGYSQTKWVSERLVAIAGERGLPIVLYRPPLIAGDSQTGVWNTDDFLGRMIKGCIRMRSVPQLELVLDISPVDYVSKAIVYLSLKQSSLGKAFHLQNPQPLPWKKLIKFARSLGYPMQVMTYKVWTEKLLESNDKDNPLYPLIPFFTQKWSEDNLTYIEMMNPNRVAKISCEATLKSLEGSDINCPPLEELLKTYFGYFMRSGELLGQLPIIRHFTPKQE